MTIVQVLTQQVERVYALKSEIKAREQLLTKAEVDVSATKEALDKKMKAFKKRKKLLISSEYLKSKTQLKKQC